MRGARKWAARDHDPARADHIGTDCCLEEIADPAQRSHFRTKAKRESHLLRVALLVVGDLVLLRKRVAAPRERDPR